MCSLLYINWTSIKLKKMNSLRRMWWESKNPEIFGGACWDSTFSRLMLGGLNILPGKGPSDWPQKWNLMGELPGTRQHSVQRQRQVLLEASHHLKAEVYKGRDGQREGRAGSGENMWDLHFILMGLDSFFKVMGSFWGLLTMTGFIYATSLKHFRVERKVLNSLFIISNIGISKERKFKKPVISCDSVLFILTPVLWNHCIGLP